MMDRNKICYLAFALLFGAFGAANAQAQGYPPPGAGSQASVCVRLESQLAAVDRGTADPARAEQIRRYEDTAGRQQAELDRTIAQYQRMGCQGGGFFSLFSSQPAQCGPLNGQIQQMRANLDRALYDLERLKGGTADQAAQRRGLLIALAQNDCGPQYRQAAAQQQGGGFFEQLFGPGGGSIFGPSDTQSSTYRTICVRTCDGFFYPVSFSTVPSRFRDDEKICQSTCPAAEVMLFSHRNPGEEVAQATSLSGKLYTELPNAFKYRQSFDPSCSCKKAGQTWAEALKQLDDYTVERGDIVVTEEKAKTLSQPKDAQGRPLATPRPPAGKPDPKAAANPPAASDSASNAAPEKDATKRTVRSVGPTFIPVR
jgi:Protein of unknown function (DUF2865)